MPIHYEFRARLAACCPAVWCHNGHTVQQMALLLASSPRASFFISITTEWSEEDRNFNMADLIRFQINLFACPASTVGYSSCHSLYRIYRAGAGDGMIPSFPLSLEQKTTAAAASAHLIYSHYVDPSRLVTLRYLTPAGLSLSLSTCARRHFSSPADSLLFYSPTHEICLNRL